MDKKKIAVFFGGKSFEHDVSILTGLEAYFSIDTTVYEPIPVYIDINGAWWTGPDLLQRRSYPLTPGIKRRLGEASLIVGQGKPFIRVKRKAILTHTQDIYFDCALLAFHGDYGEDGSFQGLFEAIQVPYTGTRVMASSVFMNKHITKRILRTLGIPVVDDILIQKPKKQKFMDVSALTKDLKIQYPVIVKPNSLGSSVGLTKAADLKELNAGILKIFSLGADALIEPYVENLEEFNISVSKVFGETSFSAIERPKKKEDSEGVLDFKQKYLSGSKGKFGFKKTFGPSELSSGLLGMTRDFNPKDLSSSEANNIRKWSALAFETLQGTGAVRIDFLCDTKKRLFYMNEVNTIPGSMSFYLWAAAKNPVIYTQLLTALIEEAFNEFEMRQGRTITLTESKIFGRN